MGAIAIMPERSFGDFTERRRLCGGEGSLLYTTPVGQVCTRGIVTAREDITIKEAAMQMSRQRIGSLVLVDDAGVPVGILTDRDLRDKVIARERSLLEPVRYVMSSPVQKVEAREYFFEALLKMMKFSIHHLLVVQEGALVGIVTNHDLLMFQGASPIAVIREVEGQQSLGGLQGVLKRAEKAVEILVMDGASATHVTGVITAINDRIACKVLDMAHKKFGPPPLPYAWIAMGSEGRGEQTYKTDQDNALIIADAPAHQAEAAGRYFAELAAYVNEALISLGYPRCPAGFMAMNQEWRKSLQDWKRCFNHCIGEPSAEAVLKALILFDFRHIYGDASLCAELRLHVGAMAMQSRVFLGSMANSIIQNRPPLGIFRSLVLEKKGERKGSLDLKVKGLAPIVDLARLFSLEKGVRETSTMERLKVLRAQHSIVGEYGQALEAAFDYLMLLRIHHQYAQLKNEVEPDNYLYPASLSRYERAALKEHLSVVLKVQDMVIELYRASIM